MRGLTYHPLTAERWADLERLFGEKGACAGCWCMWWRLKRSEWEKGKGPSNKKAFKKLVGSEEPLGVLAYAQGKPVGWCAVSPRESLPVLERSRVLKRVDGQPVWSISCFFVERSFRRKGVTRGLLKAAVQYANSRGAWIVEGYPVEPRKGTMPDLFAATGLASAFRTAGFQEVARRSETRPIMRYGIPSESRKQTG